MKRYSLAGSAAVLLLAGCQTQVLNNPPKVPSEITVATEQQQILGVEGVTKSPKNMMMKKTEEEFKSNTSSFLDKGHENKTAIAALTPPMITVKTPVIASQNTGKMGVTKQALKPEVISSNTLKSTTTLKPSNLTQNPPLVTSVEKQWRIEKGTTLKDGIMAWAVKEVCSAADSINWTVIWETPINYRIDALLQFKGNFKSALNGIFSLYRNAQKPLYVETNTPQCLIQVMEQ
ncbi:toxin co-regulated pilus biosynthesis Q family protein [Photorhabdus australis]|uniref:toxin co-regulated pilus biosynthesis Q family protein n=1 Tax=Photorhabdus australis TaxID=286156 RepID=UPI00068E3D1F|nr:toxin co-regulated pilus biosynthesis Q family protein [Photorhabdus australis]